MSLDYSHEYLYWDQKEEATVVLQSVYDSDSNAYVAATYEEVIIRRDSQRRTSPSGGGFSTESPLNFWRVPAALVDGNSPKSGDTIQVGSETWTVSGEVGEVRRGSSLVYFACPCTLQQG
ncbi:hypothetical protein KOR42_22760 [Thalassoglobus neptunius]|uniref:Uncharacterized protein n=1 Tax=Thalassoglobus neptunius TaxID=1938619 RepID=A0A5C5X859_9PLAN|nr:hypothetical protein [Thalassoglobus neptunius]TWT58889.1 hypothetical protein KOR42_22760 [Thalassoglobus neptunius]